ncbi:hypothetical protein ACFYW8_21700 [Streptomyces sp. NPDC002742]|uniref:hypothetical protein n=1 Tax=Streptomyces sp. NPDC002742 TaxID=3364663 RepID=UPI00368D2E0F
MSAPLPQGDLTDAAALYTPSSALTDALSRAAAVSAARLRLYPPPFDDPRPPRLGTALLAAAIGARDRPRQACRLITAMPEPNRGYEWPVAHLMVHHALRTGLDPELGRSLRAASPLTGLLDHPAESARAASFDVLLTALTSEGGRQLLLRELCVPPTSAAQALWRGELMSRIRIQHWAFVLDVYETALSRYGVAYRRRTEAAVRAARVGALEQARPMGVWWRGLAELRRARPALVRARGGIRGYADGVGLHRWLRNQEGEPR